MHSLRGHVDEDGRCLGREARAGATNQSVFCRRACGLDPQASALVGDEGFVVASGKPSPPRPAGGCRHSMAGGRAHAQHLGED